LFGGDETFTDAANKIADVVPAVQPQNPPPVVHIAKRSRLAQDWLPMEDRQIKSISLSDINTKTSDANAKSAAESAASMIRKRPKAGPAPTSAVGVGPGSSAKFPNVGEIFKATVCYVDAPGVTMRLPPPYHLVTGLVHNSQVTPNKDFNVKTVKINDNFYVKVVAIRMLSDSMKMDLSIKYCEQVGGSDLDPTGGNFEREMSARGGGAGRGGNKPPTSIHNYSSSSSHHAPQSRPTYSRSISSDSSHRMDAPSSFIPGDMEMDAFEPSVYSHPSPAPDSAVPEERPVSAALKRLADRAAAAAIADRAAAAAITDPRRDPTGRDQRERDRERMDRALGAGAGTESSSDRAVSAAPSSSRSSKSSSSSSSIPPPASAPMAAPIAVEKRPMPAPMPAPVPEPAPASNGSGLARLIRNRQGNLLEY
jgi:hypothetical protein